MPHGEAHEFKLLLTHLQLREAGKKSIPLGQGLGLDHLKQVREAMNFSKAHFVTFFTTPQPDDEIHNYLKNISKLFESPNSIFHRDGKQLDGLEIENSDLIHINNVSYTLI